MYPNIMRRLRDLIRRPPAPPTPPDPFFGSTQQTWDTTEPIFDR